MDAHYRYVARRRTGGGATLDQALDRHQQVDREVLGRLLLEQERQQGNKVAREHVALQWQMPVQHIGKERDQRCNEDAASALGIFDDASNRKR